MDTAESTQPTDETQPTLEESVRLHFEAAPDVIEGIHTQEDVEQVALDIVDKTAEGQELFKAIKEERERGGENKRAVDARNRLWRQISIEVSLITGVEIEAREHEAQRDNYRASLATIISTIDPQASDEEVMEKLGMVRPATDKTRRVFTFPSQILPPYIKEQWDTYTGMVEQFTDAQRKLERGVITQADFNGIDILRTRAHNSVASSIGEILEFPGWEFKDYRHLVEKMRDEKFAEPRGEMRTYANLVREKIIPPEHLTTIHRQLGRRATG